MKAKIEKLEKKIQALNDRREELFKLKEPIDSELTSCYKKI